MFDDDASRAKFVLRSGPTPLRAWRGESFHAPFGRSHSSEFRRQSVGSRVGKIIIAVPRAVRVGVTNEDRRLGVGSVKFRDFGLHSRHNGQLDHQRSLFSVAHVDPRPSLGRQAIPNRFQLGEGTWLRLRSPLRQLVAVEDSHGDVVRHGQQILFSQIVQILAEMGHFSEFVIGGDPPVRQTRPSCLNHLQRQFVPGVVTVGLGHAGIPTPRGIFRPFRRQVQTKVAQGMLAPRYVCQKNSDLAIVDLPRVPTPLPSHAHRLLSALGKGREVDHDRAARSAELAESRKPPAFGVGA